MKKNIYQRSLWALIYITISGCSCPIPSDYDHTLLFNDWFDEHFIAEGSISEKSPSKNFSIEYVWDSPDSSGKEFLLLVHNKTKQRLVIGKSNRGCTFQWVKTTRNDLLIINHLQDTHFTESFVIRPCFSEHGYLSFSKLYTISCPNTWRVEDVDYFYTEIESTGEEGDIFVNLSYRYKNKVYNRKLKMPLYRTNTPDFRDNVDTAAVEIAPFVKISVTSPNSL